MVYKLGPVDLRETDENWDTCRNCKHTHRYEETNGEGYMGDCFDKLFPINNEKCFCTSEDFLPMSNLKYLQYNINMNKNIRCKYCKLAIIYYDDCWKALRMSPKKGWIWMCEELPDNTQDDGHKPMTNLDYLLEKYESKTNG